MYIDPLGIKKFQFFSNLFFNEYYYKRIQYPPTMLLTARRKTRDQRKIRGSNAAKICNMKTVLHID